MNRTGEYIRKLRNQLGLTTRDLGQITGYTNAAISMWERGERQVNVHILWKLIQAMNINDISKGLHCLALDAGVPESALERTQEGVTDANIS